jgi:hypothetical protein
MALFCFSHSYQIYHVTTRANIKAIQEEETICALILYFELIYSIATDLKSISE